MRSLAACRLDLELGVDAEVRAHAHHTLFTQVKATRSYENTSLGDATFQLASCKTFLLESLTWGFVINADSEATRPDPVFIENLGTQSDLHAEENVSASLGA